MLGRSKLATNRSAPLEAQLLHDLLARALVGGRGQRDARDAGEALGEDAQLAVLGAEVVAPLRDAVRLVDGEEGDVDLGEKRQHALLHEALGRDVEEVERAGLQLPLDGLLLGEGQRRVEEGRLDARGFERVDLILHERDQRRDDDAGAAPHEGGDLVAERLAAARRHEDQRVAAGEHRLHDGRLVQPEGVVAEHALQHRQRGAEIGGRFGFALGNRGHGSAAGR